ncbi:hypothetical protein GUITHDRAFT_147448 [Guillardia theta CCMP2712]|uniref:Uncharacterized protein n=1 Tax=Guillardia theta (strain CCMP2712) TaxID=905079 RepID=L1ICY2_GUITC|nr:hypothetical protein GUITHDRAFT_147448 [Guillardia theta CCMP2712]EKX34098.1 hypothetical protein GUITHDRAFT_147448 [Guillardia theta CCMP2712]|eukprot:XP_005821078.1 hypothetical protein GUITHDRAFT_147448 [Guillardia theta CCMP2712]
MDTGASSLETAANRCSRASKCPPSPESEDFQEVARSNRKGNDQLVKRQKLAASSLDVEVMQVKLRNKTSICKVVRSERGAARMIAYAEKQDLFFWYLDINGLNTDIEEDVEESNNLHENDRNLPKIDGFALSSTMDTIWYLPANNVGNFKECLSKIFTVDCQKVTFSGTTIFPILLDLNVECGPPCRMLDLSVLVAGAVQANFHDMSKQRMYQRLSSELDICLDKLVPELKDLKAAKIPSKTLCACANALKIHWLYLSLFGGGDCQSVLDDKSRKCMLELDTVLVHALAHAEYVGLRIDFRALRNITTLLRSRQNELNEELSWRSEMQRDYAHVRAEGGNAQHPGQSIGLLDADSMKRMHAELREVQTSLYTFVDPIWKNAMKCRTKEVGNTEDLRDYRVHLNIKINEFAKSTLSTCRPQLHVIPPIRSFLVEGGSRQISIDFHDVFIADQDMVLIRCTIPHLMEWAIALVSEDAIFAECLVGEAVWDAVAKKWISMSGFPNCSGEIPISKQVEIIVDGLKRGNSLDIIAQNLMVPLAMFESVLSSFSSVFPSLVNKVGLHILVLQIASNEMLKVLGVAINLTKRALCRSAMRGSFCKPIMVKRRT